MNTRRRGWLVLDVDETLVGHRRPPLPGADAAWIHGRGGDLPTGIYARPHLDRFLDWALERYHVGLWTAAPQAHAERAARHLLGARASELALLWSERQCRVRALDARGAEVALASPDAILEAPLKEVSSVVEALGADPRRLLVVDDSPWAVDDPAHHVPIPPYVLRNARALPSETLLLELMTYLDTLADVDDVRDVDKTGWLAPRWVLRSRRERMVPGA